MNKTILLAPNSFKECADSTKIAEILLSELKSSADLNIISRPLSDGGDGFFLVCEKLFDGIRINYSVTNIHDKNLIQVPIVYNEKSKIGYIESAEIIGLKRVPVNRRKPLELNTKALGELIWKIAADVKDSKLDVTKLIIGIGGTATTDFGFGAVSYFGLKLLDEHNSIIDIKPGNYNKVKKLYCPEIHLPFNVEVISDVDTLLFGDNNSLHLYSSQKGADKEDILILANGFNNIYNILLNNKLVEYSKPINGAGGGLAAGLNIFFAAKIISSSEFINNHILHDMETNHFDAVITGEGAFDIQSLENKGAYTIILKFKALKIPVFLICGTIDDSVIHQLPSNVQVIELRKYFSSVEESIKNYGIGLKKAASEITNHLKN